MTQKKRAVLYLRSSKDRSDVAIATQRHQLKQLAKSKDILIVHEFTDVVESAKDDNRPGFQSLLYDLTSPARAWNTILLLDTSRLFRRQYMAQVFNHEAQKHGVQILYAKIPETDPIIDKVIIGIMQIFDELHSLMSREKGLAGMAENVRQGYRAGGRAPIGYRRKQIETGAIRDGQPVVKTRLESTEDSHQIARYLKMRAAGHSRQHAKSESGLTLADTTLIGIEWNALTYAGHTVWNVRNEYHPGSILQQTKKGSYKGKTKRRPREEWVINHDTHDALITTEEAEALLAQLEQSPQAKARRTPATYLLTGVLKTPANDSWFGDGKRYYRTKPVDGRKHCRVDLASLDNAVINQVVQDLNSTAFVKHLTEEAKKQSCGAQSDPIHPLRVEAENLNGQISRAMDLALQLTDSAPALRKVDELEARRKQLLEEIARQETKSVSTAALTTITEADVTKALKDIGQNIKQMGREALKDALFGLVDRVSLDPDTLDCAIHYRIAVGRGNKVASPRGVEPLSPP